MQKQDIESIVSILSRAIENDHDHERIAALNMARLRMKRFNVSLEQLVSGRGSAIDMLRLFTEMRSRVEKLERENEALLRRHNRLFPEDTTPIHTEGWQTLVELAGQRYLTIHGHVRAHWRNYVMQDLGLTRHQMSRWESGDEEVPEDVLERLRAIPESPYLSNVAFDEQTGKYALTTRPYMNWGVSDLMRLNELAQEPFTIKKIARILSEEFGRTITVSSVRYQIVSRNLRKPGHFVDKNED